MDGKTNMQKIKKRIEANPDAVIKPFNLSYRKFSETSVINLPKEKVVTKFVKAEKKVRVEKETTIKMESEESETEGEEDMAQREEALRERGKEKEKKKRNEIERDESRSEILLGN